MIVCAIVDKCSIFIENNIYQAGLIELAMLLFIGGMAPVQSNGRKLDKEELKKFKVNVIRILVVQTVIAQICICINYMKGMSLVIICHIVLFMTLIVQKIWKTDKS